MIRFVSYDTDGRAQAGPLRNAVLIDKDEVVTPGRIKVRDGHIVCERRASGAMALGLRFDAGRPGDLALRTCLLPQREDPYILTVELARHRIGTFVFKAEEWGMIDLDESHPAMKMWNEARHLFTQAMVTSDPVQADKAGRQSLELAIAASERLAVAHSEILLRRRFKSKPAPSTAIGVRIEPSRRGEALKELAHRHFRLLAVPLRWSSLCPSEGAYRWDDTDDWIAWAEDHGCRVISGPLIDLGRRGLPGWVSSKVASYEHLRDLAYEHVEAVVARYGDHIGMWSLGTGLNTNTTMSLEPREMIDLVRMLSLRVREGRRGRRVLIELEQPWSEYLYSHAHAVGPLAFVEQIMQAGVRLDAVGLSVRMGDDGHGRTVRDLMELSRLLDRFVHVDPRIIVTDLGVPSEAVGDTGGRWRGDWTAERQAQWASIAVAMMLSKPHVESVLWTDLFDHPETRPPHAGLIAGDGTAKEAIKRLITLRKKLSKPFGPAPEAA
jgi:hypothetical protein